MEQIELLQQFEKSQKYNLADSWCDWIPTMFDPKQFLTLTSRDFVYQEVLLHRYGYLMRKVNKDLFGNNWYRRGQGVSFVLGIEPQNRGVLHLHAVWDQPKVDYKMIHSIWQRISGYAWIEPVNAITGVAHYVSKYSIKGGQVMTYISERQRAAGQSFGLADPSLGEAV